MSSRGLKVGLLLLISSCLLLSSCSESTMDVLTRLEKTHNDQQIEAFVDCFSDSALFRISGGWTATGKAEIRYYAEWDAAINSTLQFSNVRISGDTISCSLREENDWFRQMSLESIIYDTVRVVILYGRVVRLEARQEGANLRRANKLFEEFLKWASKSQTQTLVELMDGASFVFTKKTAGRWLALLAEWRMSVSKPPKTTYDLQAELLPDLNSVRIHESVRLSEGLSDSIYEVKVDIPWDPLSPAIVRSGGSVLLPTGYLEHGTPQASLVFYLPKGIPTGSGSFMEIDNTISCPAPDSMHCTILNDWYGLVGLAGGGESQNDYNVSITVPSGAQVITSGRFASSFSRYDAADIRRFGIAFGRNFGTAIRSVGPTTIRSFIPVSRSKNATRILEAAMRCMLAYNEAHSAFPYPALTIVESDYNPFTTYTLPTGFIAVDSDAVVDSSKSSSLEWQIAHQMARQYWFEYILTNERDSWLAFGLATDMSSEYLRSRRIPDRFSARILEDYAQVMLAGEEVILETPGWGHKGTDLENAELLRLAKGYALIRTLRYLLGEAYERAIDRCLQEYAGYYLNPYGFQQICEQEFGQDLEWLFSPWLRTNAVLSYRIVSSDCELYGDRYVTAVTVERLGSIRMPIPVAVRFEDGTEQMAYTRLNAEQQTLVFESLAPLKESVLDPEERLPLISVGPSENSGQL